MISKFLRHFSSLINPNRLNPTLRYLRYLEIKKSFIEIDTHSIVRGSLISIDSEVSIGSNAGFSGSITANKSKVIIQDSCQITKSVFNAYEHEIFVGRFTTVFSNLYLAGDVHIGEKCLFADNINIMSGYHIIDGREYIRKLDQIYFDKHGHSPSKQVVIGEESWIGSRAIILPGVQLGRGVVVGAGAVVTNSFPDYSVIGGIPAKIIKFR